MPPKSLYTPIFNTRQPASSSSSNSTPISTTNYIQTLSRLHLSLASLPPSYELPDSRPSSPSTDERIENRRRELKKLFDYSGGDTSSGKWGLVWENVRMGCTRAYRVVGVGSNNIHTEKEEGEKKEWLLPETEAEWEEWEKICSKEDGLKMKVKLWQKHVNGDGQGQSMDVEVPQSLKELYENRPEEREVDVVVESPKKKDKDKEEKELELAKMNDPSSLGFPVVKRSCFTAAAAAAAAGKKGSHKGKEKEAEPMPPPISQDVNMASPEIVPKPITELTELVSSHCSQNMLCVNY
jgi:hypothetical protein